MPGDQSPVTVSVKRGGFGSPGYLAEGGAPGQHRPVCEPLDRTGISYLAFVIPASRPQLVLFRYGQCEPKNAGTRIDMAGCVRSVVVRIPPALIHGRVGGRSVNRVRHALGNSGNLPTGAALLPYLPT